MKIITEKEFENEIKEGVTLVDFFATWCMPCKMMAKILEEVEGKLPANSKIVKVDVDESESLARKFGILSIPTIIIFKDGQQVFKHVGLMQEEDCLQAIENA